MLTSFTHGKQVSGQSIWWTSAWVQMKPWRPFVRLLSRKIVSFVKRYKSVTQKLWCFVPPWSLSIWLQNHYPRQVVCTGSGRKLPQRKTFFQIRKFWINLLNKKNSCRSSNVTQNQFCPHCKETNIPFDFEILSLCCESSSKSADIMFWSRGEGISKVDNID